MPERKFILSCCSTVDLPYAHMQERDIPVLFFTYNIGDTVLSDEKDDLSISKEKILAQIEESSSSFHSSETSTIRFTIINDSDRLRLRLQDDFPKLSFTKEGFFIKTSISEPLFAKIVSYGDDIKIDDPEVADRYIRFLQKIITRNSSGNRNNQ